MISFNLHQAEYSFENVLNLWESRLHFDRIRNRLETKSERFNESCKIINTPEFNRLYELKDKFIEFLKENEKLVLIPEIRNSMKLSKVISESFNLPRLGLDDLADSGKYSIPVKVSDSIYEYLCRQELLAKELLESKTDLDHIWLVNEKVQKLPFFIFESDEKTMQYLD